MEEDIKILEHIINNFKRFEENSFCDTKFKESYKKGYQAIENLINRNKELEEMLKNRIKYTNELEKDLFENASNYVVPKSLIKEKIEELKHEKFKRTQLGVFILKNYENQKLLGQIQVLEELLNTKM